MSPVPMVRSLIPVHISGVIRPVCIPLYHQNLHGHKEILQHHDSQHIAVGVSSEPLRKTSLEIASM